MSEFYDQPVVCTTHTDLDGHCSAAVVRKRYPDCKVFYNNYGRPLFSGAFIPGSKMIVTDFTLLEHEFEKCKHMNISVQWIDHHLDNFRSLENKGICLPGLRDDKFCGAALAWKFLFPGREMPRAVQYVNDYDLWKFELPDTKKFQAGLQLYETRVNMQKCFIWNELLNDNPGIANKAVDRVIDLGARILAYNNERNSIFCKDVVYRATLPTGQKCLVAGIKGANSSFFDSVPDRLEMDALCMAQYSTDIKKYRCSVYAPDKTKIVLPIAKSFGGGGHPGAAGFQACDYPFPKPERVEPRPMSTVIPELQKILELRKDSILNQSACRQDRINLGAHTFNTRFNQASKLCLAINHPYLSELIRILPSAVDLINPETGEFAGAVVGYTLTNSGWYRCGFYLLDQGSDSGKSFNAETFKNSLPKLDPNGRVDSVYEEDLGSLGKVMWWYSTDIPVIVPIDRITRT